MTEQPAPAQKDQKPRHRSPNYPGIGLRAAIAKIEALYKADGLAPSPKLAALKHMGYDKLHSEAARTLSALKSFGLVDEGADRIKLTPRGVAIVASSEGDARRQKAIKDSAVSPEIYQQVMEEYRLTGLPSDSSLKSDLIINRKFNPTAVDGFVRDFRDTLEFAGLSNFKETEAKQVGDDGGDQKSPLQVGDFVQWESSGQIQFQEPKRIRAVADDGRWAFVDGSDTGLPIQELTVASRGTTDKPGERVVAGDAPPLPVAKAVKFETPLQISTPPKMRSYSWALSGDFSAKLDLFGNASSEEDIDALSDYVAITVKALKRSLKAQGTT